MMFDAFRDLHSMPSFSETREAKSVATSTRTSPRGAPGRSIAEVVKITTIYMGLYRSMIEIYWFYMGFIWVYVDLS